MLSRRNIRIKVMQVLYAMSRDPEMTSKNAVVFYHDAIRHSFELYLFNLFQLQRVAEYAATDYQNKRAKLRPTEEDKAFHPWLAQNELVASLQNNADYKTLLTTHKIKERIIEDNTRLLYNEFAKTDTYKEYYKLPNPNAQNHQLTLLALYKTLNSNTLFEDIMEENFLTWHDDKSLVIGAIKKTLKMLPANGAFYLEHQPDHEAVNDFGEKLLTEVCMRNEELLEIIEPALKNWEPERVAILDMIMLKMALVELMFFPTIPTKVTLNEYVEISKLYSTDKSKDFINGILDRLMKKLATEGRIEKSGRGLIDD